MPIKSIQTALGWYKKKKDKRLLADDGGKKTKTLQLSTSHTHKKTVILIDLIF